MTTPYDSENGTDATDAISKAGSLSKIEFRRKDCKFWIQQIEARMRLIGIKSQWTKMQVVSCLLPEDVAEQVKHLLRIEETEAGTDCYKRPTYSSCMGIRRGMSIEKQTTW